MKKRTTFRSSDPVLEARRTLAEGKPQPIADFTAQWDWMYQIRPEIAPPPMPESVRYGIWDVQMKRWAIYPTATLAEANEIRRFNVTGVRN